LKANKNIENLFTYALFLQENRQNLQALTKYKECLEIQHSTINTRYIPRTADILNNIGVLYTNINKFKDAEENLTKALEQKVRLAKFDSELFLPDVATTLNNLGNLQKDQIKFQKAEATYKKALKIRKELVESKGDKYLPDLADSLHFYGVLKIEVKKKIMLRLSY